MSVPHPILFLQCSCIHLVLIGQLKILVFEIILGNPNALPLTYLDEDCSADGVRISSGQGSSTELPVGYIFYIFFFPLSFSLMHCRSSECFNTLTYITFLIPSKRHILHCLMRKNIFLYAPSSPGHVQSTPIQFENVHS